MNKTQRGMLQHIDQHGYLYTEKRSPKTRQAVKLQQTNLIELDSSYYNWLVDRWIGVEQGCDILTKPLRLQAELAELGKPVELKPLTHIEKMMVEAGQMFGYGKCRECDAVLNETNKCPRCGAHAITDAEFERENRRS